MKQLGIVVEWLRKEIDIMREILGHMLQEEAALLTQDKESWTKLMMQRAELYSSLYNVREERIRATAAAFPDGKELSFEKILAVGDENCCNILLLRDQMVSLIEKLNLQSARNELLSRFSSQQKPLSSGQIAPQPKKSKISIATIPPKE